jgi:hypothetical protein
MKRFHHGSFIVHHSLVAFETLLTNTPCREHFGVFSPKRDRKMDNHGNCHVIPAIEFWLIIIPQTCRDSGRIGVDADEDTP